MLSTAAAYAQTPTATPAPAPDGVIPAIVDASSGVASWLDGLSVEYTGMSLWMSFMGIVFIVVIVSLFLWLRRPRRPTETRAPM
jgi:hypothetical protein